MPLTSIRAISFRIGLSLAILLTNTACSSLLYFPAKDPFTDPQQFRHKPEDVTFASEDGVKLHGWYFKSDKRPAKGTLLFFHGNAQNLTTHFYALYWLLDQGYDYFIFDYRGYGASEGKPTPEGTLKDGRAALRWINEHRDPNGRLTIFAQSLGTAIGLRVACDAAGSGVPNEAYDQVVVDSGFLSYERAAQKIMSRAWILWPFQWLPFLVFSDKFAPNDCVSRISPHRLLVIHGTADQTIAYSLGEKVFAEAREPKQFWKIEGGRHTDFLFRENFLYQTKLLEWLTQTSTQPIIPAPKK